MAERRYELTLDELSMDEPWIKDAGHLYKISGLLLQGEGRTILLCMPNFLFKDNGFEDRGDIGDFEVKSPTLNEWSAFLRASDEPLIFEQDETGTLKAFHRKSAYGISGAIQQKIWVRDDLQCMYCGRTMGDVALTIDHFIPLDAGGVNNETNYLTCCRKCNKRKGNIHPEHFCRDRNYDYNGLKAYMEGKANKSFIFHLRK